MLAIYAPIRSSFSCSLISDVNLSGEMREHEKEWELLDSGEKITNK